MLIEVTEEDIKQGASSNCFYCPVALACKRHSSDVCAGISQIRIGQTWYTTPDQTKNWIENFDHHIPVKPFSFKLTELWPY